MHERRLQLVTLTADIVAAYVSSNAVPFSGMAGLIEQVHSALAALGSSAPEIQVKSKPAVSIRASVKPNYVVCLEDGKMCNRIVAIGPMVS